MKAVQSPNGNGAVPHPVKPDFAAALDAAPIRVLLVGASCPWEEVRRAFLAKGAEFALAQAPGFAEARRFLERPGAEAAVVDVGGADDISLQRLANLRDGFPDTAFVALGDRADDAVAIGVLQQGAEEYLVKGDFEGATLVRKVRYAVERRRTTLQEMAVFVVPEPEGVLEAGLLQKILDSEGRILVPRPEVLSPFGYAYPAASERLGTEPGGEVETLERLAQAGYLRRVFHDRIHLCAFCSNHALNFREVCPRCRSADVDIVEILHHYRCAHVAPEVDFSSGGELRCPKCRHELRHVGMDYERPGAHYLCASCRFVFQDPPVQTRCLSCDRFGEVHEARVRVVHAYTLTPRGEVAAIQGELEPDGP